MKRLTNYNDFLLEKEFQKIVYEIFKLVENSPTFVWDFQNDDKDKVNVGDTITWDVNPSKKIEPVKDEDPLRMEWTFDQKTKYQKFKDKLADLKTKVKTAKDWLQEPDPDVKIQYEHPLVEMVREFLSKLKDKEKVKQYFLRILDELKSLPYGVKKNLLIKLSFMFLGYVSIADLTTPEIIEKEPVMSEVKVELQKVKPESEEIKVDKKFKDLQGASFEEANKLVSFAEGGYTSNPVDGGNYTSKGGYLIGTNHGIAAFTLIKTNVKPTSKKEIKALKQCYGNRYQELCGDELLSFGEQWELDQKYVNPRDIGVKWKNIMMSLEKETATLIYENEYWNPQDFSKIKSQSIANILYDACVNQGPGVAKKVYVRSMDKLGHDVDGVDSWDDVHEKLTPVVNTMDKDELKELHQEIKDQRLEQYRENADPDEIEEFSKGWENRLAKVINTFDEGDIS